MAMASSYVVARRIGRRLKGGGPVAVWILRALAVILLGPAIGANLLALWPARGRAPARPDIYVIIMDAYRADRLGWYGGKRLAPTRGAVAARGGRSAVRGAFAVPGMAEPFEAAEARALMDSGTVLLFAGGTGNPFFTTDTACALRGREVGAGLWLQATQVDGGHSAEPVKDPRATR